MKFPVEKASVMGTATMNLPRGVRCSGVRDGWETAAGLRTHVPCLSHRAKSANRLLDPTMGVSRREAHSSLMLDFCQQGALKTTAQ